MRVLGHSEDDSTIGGYTISSVGVVTHAFQLCVELIRLPYRRQIVIESGTGCRHFLEMIACQDWLRFAICLVGRSLLLKMVPFCQGYSCLEGVLDLSTIPMVLLISLFPMGLRKVHYGFLVEIYRVVVRRMAVRSLEPVKVHLPNLHGRFLVKRWIIKTNVNPRLNRFIEVPDAIGR